MNGRFRRARRRALAAALVALAATLASGCGYRAVYGGPDAAHERFHVALARGAIPYAAAVDEVVVGVRERLAQEGALSDGEGYPRVEIEVLRVDEMSEGVLSTPSGASAGAATPRARGVSLGLVIRAWIRRAPDAPEERDTGDLRALALVAVDRDDRAAFRADPQAALFSEEDALRALGRRLGHRAALRVLGFAVPADDGVGVER